MTSRKIYAHTHYEVYCPDCFYTIWEGHQIKTDIVRCIKCGQIVHIDWERGVSEVGRQIEQGGKDE
jgi:ribosomal protein L37AE/L43A